MTATELRIASLARQEADLARAEASLRRSLEDLGEAREALHDERMRLEDIRITEWDRAHGVVDAVYVPVEQRVAA